MNATHKQTDEQNNKLKTINWNPSQSVPAVANLQCIQSGCYTTAEINVLSPENCRVPLLSLNFWLTGILILSSFVFSLFLHKYILAHIGMFT